LERKLLFGTILCFILLLLMPVIPALKLKASRGVVGNSPTNQPDTIFMKRINDLVKKGQLPVHPVFFLS